MMQFQTQQLRDCNMFKRLMLTRKRTKICVEIRYVAWQCRRPKSARHSVDFDQVCQVSSVPKVSDWQPLYR